MDNHDIQLMWEWYVMPAIIITLFMGVLIIAGLNKDESDPYQIDGVNREEIVSRWEGNNG